MIYILEDDDNIRKLVIFALTKEGYIVKGFAMPSEFYRAMDEETPDLVLLDIMLPEEDGISILRKLREERKLTEMGIIMLTAKSSEFDVVQGLDGGADDYIPKPFGMTTLVSRVRAVLRRVKPELTESKIYNVGALYVDKGKHIIRVKDQEITLSLKEYSLLIMLLEAKGQVVDRDTLLREIWGEFYEESRTLDVHIRKLRVKLLDAGSMIKTVKGIGYKLERE